MIVFSSLRAVVSLIKGFGLLFEGSTDCESGMMLDIGPGLEAKIPGSEPPSD